MNLDEHYRHQLTKNISSLAMVLCELVAQKKLEFDWIKSHHAFATKHDLNQIKEEIMATIKDYVTSVNAQFAAIGASVDEIIISQVGIAADVQSLKDTIAEQNSNPGPISAEDQVLLDDSQAQATALASKLAALSAALKALDQVTNAAPPSPTP